MHLIQARRLAVAALGMAVLLGACANQHTQVSNVDALYVQRLNGRLAGYNQSAAELDADLKRQAEATNATVPAVAGVTLPAANPNLPDEIFRASETHARAAILGRFMHEGAASGQFGLMWSWLQTQSMDLTRFSKDTDAAVTLFQQDAARDPHNTELAGRFYKLLVERGAERGAGEELMTIGIDLQGYQQDYAGAAAVDTQRRQDTIKLLSAYLSAPRVTVQAPSYAPALPHGPTFTTCTPNIFGSVNCTTH